MKTRNVCISRRERKGRRHHRTRSTFALVASALAAAIFLTPPAALCADDAQPPTRVQGPHRVTRPMTPPDQGAAARPAPENLPAPAPETEAAESRQPEDVSNADTAQPERRDGIMGTFHEGMVIEKDPQTGDSIMQVGPDPMQPQQTLNGNGSGHDLEIEVFVPVRPYRPQYNRPQPRNAKP